MATDPISMMAALAAALTENYFSFNLFWKHYKNAKAHQVIRLDGGIVWIWPEGEYCIRHDNASVGIRFLPTPEEVVAYLKEVNIG